MIKLLEGGRIFQKFDLERIVLPLLRWSPDGKALIYVAEHERLGNVWSQPVDGVPLSRGRPQRDVVFLENFR